MPVSAWSTDPNANITQLGSSLADGVTRLPALNDLIRTLMAQLAEERDRVNAAIATAQSSDPTLSSFAALSIAADVLPYGSAADAFSTTPFTAFARTLLDDADATTARTTLGAQAALGFTPLNAASVSAYALTLLDDNNAAAARGTLELGTAATRNASGGAGAVAALDAANAWSEQQSFTANAPTRFERAGSLAQFLLELRRDGSVRGWLGASDTDALIVNNVGGSPVFTVSGTGGPATLASALTINGFTVYHSGNDGAGSLLDAGLFAGQTPEQFRALSAGITSGTLTISDVHEIVRATAGVTVPANVFSAGQWIIIYNNTSGNITITQGAGLTMRFGSSTGNRTIAARQAAAILVHSSTECSIHGSGLS